MRFAIVASEKDKAGMNIFNEIHENYPSLSHYPIKEDSIYADNIDKTLLKDYDFIIFTTKHQGKTEKMLSVHAPGNWRDAKFGGRENTICPTSARILKIFFQELNKNLPESWQATMECTHHGPYIEKPCLFIEIGSNEENWQDKSAGRAIAKTINSAISRVNSEKEEFVPAIGIGGPHYCANFNKIQASSKYAIGHIIPEYIFPTDEKMLQEAIEKTEEKPDTAIIDWKGLGKSEQKQEILKLLSKLNLKVLRTSEIEK